jgi:hypothetical protein
VPKHFRNQQMVEVHRSREQGIDFGLTLRPRNRICRERDAALEAGVVNQHIDLGHIRFNMACKRLAPSRSADVVGEGSQARQLLCGSRQLFRRSSSDEYRTSRRKIARGETPANPFAASRD